MGKNEIFIQAGDVFDRADHSELAAEILRQMLLQAPNHVYVLVGNHEEFLLLENYDSWLLNEKKWTYSKGKGGNTRMLDMLTPGKSEDELLEDTWHKYQTSASMLYLTQHFSKVQSQPSLNASFEGLNSAELEEYSRRILSGSWDGYAAANELHSHILNSANEKPTEIPWSNCWIGNWQYMVYACRA